MRRSYWLLLATVLPATLAAAEPAGFAAFDHSVAVTKQAMMADPEHALASAIAAVALAHRLPAGHQADVAVGTAEWLHGEALLYLNRTNEAAPIVDRTLALVERSAPRSKLYGDLLRSHGAIASNQGHVLQALHDFHAAFEAFRAAGVPRSQAIALQDIGAIYWDAGDNARTLDYYQQSADVFSGDATLTLTMHNGRAQVFYKEKRYGEAAAEFRASLEQAKALNSPLLQVRILTYLARSEVDAGRLRSAQGAIDQAMTLSRGGEAAGWQPFVYGVAARIALEREDLPQAQALIGRTFAGVDLTHTELEFRDHHATAARIFEAIGDDRAALAHIKAVQRLDGEAQALTASAASQLAAANFDFANQKLNIAQLKQGQLQRDVQLERQRGRLTSVALAALGAIVALLGLGFVSLRRSRNALRISNAELERALKVKTDFLATTSHEIRTPLNGILGMTQVLLADRRVQADLRERLEVVQGAGETMKALVDDILDVAKMESGRLTVMAEPADVRRILRDVGLLWAGDAERKGLVLTVDIDAVPSPLLTDGARVRQVVFNLLSNALKFTSEGEVVLRGGVERGSDGTEQLIVTVRDSGIGIAPDQQELIFEAFRQADTSTTRQFGGTGLGLAICRNVARALGGDMAVASTPGEGSVFTLTLPCRHAGVATAAGSAMPAALAEARLLVVERDPAVQGLLRMMLAAEVGATDATSDAGAATIAIAAGGVDHIICATRDEALDALRALSGAAEAAGVKLTLLAAADGTVPIADLMTVGADQIVVKPIAGDALVAALASLWGDAPEPFVATGLMAQAA